MMQVIKLASSTEFATKIRKVSNFCTEVICFKLEALHNYCHWYTSQRIFEWKVLLMDVVKCETPTDPQKCGRHSLHIES